MKQKRLKASMSKAEYDAAWLAKVQAKCVRDENGCLIWQHSTNNKGYGQTAYRRKTVRAHRKTYEILHGDLPKSVLVCHRCDVRRCCEPAHLWTGSNDDNQLDAWRKGRKRMQSATHCNRGHEYTADNTRRYPSTGRRVCLACVRGRYRIGLGWPEHEAYTAPLIPPGVNTERRNLQRLGSLRKTHGPQKGFVRKSVA